MGGKLSRLNPFHTAREEEVMEIRNVSYENFVEEKFLQLITLANNLHTIQFGRVKAIEAMRLGKRGLVFIAGESPYSLNIPVCQLCIDSGNQYHIFSSGQKIRDIIQTNCSVIFVEHHPNYNGLFDLCKTAVEILHDL